MTKFVTCRACHRNVRCERRGKAWFLVQHNTSWGGACDQSGRKP